MSAKCTHAWIFGFIVTQECRACENRRRWGMKEKCVACQDGEPPGEWGYRCQWCDTKHPNPKVCPDEN